MNVHDNVTLQPRLDDYSYQVCSPADERFWFRLVREGDRDIITDYFIGSRPKESAGSLLSRCYTVLGLTPNHVIVFKDILVSKNQRDPMVLRRVRDQYTEFGKALLADFGATVIDERVEKEMDKYNLVLVAQRQGKPSIVE